MINLFIGIIIGVVITFFVLYITNKSPKPNSEKGSYWHD